MAKVLGLPAADPRVRRAALASWGNYGRTAASLLTLPAIDIAVVDARTKDLSQGMAWHEWLRSGMTPGRGAVVTTGHFGSWDLAGAMAARHVPLVAIADTFGDPRLNDLLQGHRREKSVEIIPASNAARGALRALGQGRAVAVAIDRPVAKEHGVEVTYFGHKTYVPNGSAALAVKTGAAIVPGYVWYAPKNRYYIRVFPPILPREVRNKVERLQEIQRLTQYMFECQEEIVRQCPTQWFMFRRFWPADAQAPGVESAPAIAA